jgi:hypothetical protein
LKNSAHPDLLAASTPPPQVILPLAFHSRRVLTHALFTDGLAGIRLFTPCDDEKCDVYEDHDRIRLTSARWYPSTTRLTDGSLLIAGGMIAGGYNNAESTDNPTFEYFPPKGDGLQFYSQFLHDALNSNLYPIMFSLPSGCVSSSTIHSR